MHNTIKIVLGFFRKEFAQTLRDPVMRVFLFIAPLIQLSIFGYAISNEFRNLRLAVAYEPKDVMMRQLAEHFYASRWFVRVPLDASDYEHYLRAGKADAILVAPTGGLTKNFGQGKAELQLLVDAQNASKARAIETYANNIVRMFAAQQSASGGSSPPLGFDVRMLYNPTMETPLFMVPGVMTMIISIVTVMLTGMSLAREKELGTLETIIAAPLSGLQIILGKTIPFVVIGLADATLVITAGVVLFGVPIRGSILLLILTALIFVTVTVSAGIFISTISKNQQQAMMGSFLFIFPAMMLSGIMFPIENMPQIMRIIAYFDPLYYCIKILRNIMLKGANPQLVWTNLGILAAMASVIITAAALRFRKTLD